MKGKICFGLLLALPIMLGLSLNASSDASAVSISNGIYSTAIYTKNFQSTKTVYNQGPLNIGSGALSALNEVDPTGIWDYTQALSFPNPYTNKTGTGYESSLYFTMHSTSGNFLNRNISSLMAQTNLGFELLDENNPYCSSSYEVHVQDLSTVQFLLRSSCPAGTYPEGTNFNEVEALISYEPDTIFWCANDNPSQSCPSYMGVTVYNIDYYFSLLQTPSESYQSTILNQNQTQITQNQTIINQNQQIINQDNQDRSDIQNQQNNADDSADGSQSQAESTGTTLLAAFTSFVSAITSASPSNCNIDMDLGNLDLGVVDFCTLSPPAPIPTIASIFMILFCVPLSIATARKVISLFRSFQ